MNRLKIPEKTLTPVPAGNHVALCTEVIDLGTHPTKFGPEAADQTAVELCDEFLGIGQPFTVARTYPQSMSDGAALRGDIETWRGKFAKGEAAISIFAICSAPPAC